MEPDRKELVRELAEEQADVVQVREARNSRRRSEMPVGKTGLGEIVSAIPAILPRDAEGDVAADSVTDVQEYNFPPGEIFIFPRLSGNVFLQEGITGIFLSSWIREHSRTVQMQGGNDVDYPSVISTSCQRSRCAVLDRPAGRRGADQEMRLFGDNIINSKYCIKYHLKPLRIQVVM